jgi:hypothetical protein
MFDVPGVEPGSGSATRPHVRPTPAAPFGVCGPTLRTLTQVASDVGLGTITAGAPHPTASITIHPARFMKTIVGHWQVS